MENKTAVVTGGGSGIGRAIARRFAEEGSRVIIVGRTEATLKETAAAEVTGDVYQTAAERLIMNSPGFAPVWQAALKESEEEFKKTFLGLTPYLRKHISTKASDAVLIEDDNS